MLKCSQTAPDPAVRKRYDATYKRMVRLMRDWNALEESRENTKSLATEIHQIATTALGDTDAK